MTNKRPSAWIDAIVDGVGRHFWLETTDGVEREGKITGFATKSINLNGQEVNWPTEIEINGDSMDTIPLARVAKIVID